MVFRCVDTPVDRSIGRSCQPCRANIDWDRLIIDPSPVPAQTAYGLRDCTIVCHTTSPGSQSQMQCRTPTAAPAPECRVRW